MKNILLLIFTISIFACTQDYGKVEVTYQEATAIYGDIDAVRSQALNETVRDISNPGKIYLGEDFILIGEEQEGIHVIDNYDPANPTPVNFINIPGNREYYVSDDKLYAETYYDVVKIDISDIQNATLEARAENVFQNTWKNESGETLIGFSFEEVTIELDVEDDFYEEIVDGNKVYLDYARNIIPKSALPSSFAGSGSKVSGTANRVTYVDDHVYVIGNSTMYVIADDEQFNTVNRITNIGQGMETIFPYDDNLYVGSRSAVSIFDITNPSAPTEAYEFDHATACDPVLPADGVAYVTLRTADFSACPGNTNSLLVLDTRSVNDVKQKEEISMTSPYGMTIKGNRLFVGEGEYGLKVFDISDKYRPELIRTVSDLKAYDVIPHPTIDNILLTTGPTGVSQYIIDGGGEAYTLQSSISF